MASAPAALVAVPTTFAPWRASSSAMALPMPREAPVTRATWFCRFIGSSSFLTGIWPVSAFDGGEHALQRSLVDEGFAHQRRVDTLGHADQGLARRTFDDLRHAVRGHLLH